MITKSEFGEWRDQPITQAFLQEMAETVSSMIGEIINSASSPRERDLFLKGMINGLSQAAGWQPDFVAETTEETLAGEYLAANEEDPNAP